MTARITLGDWATQCNHARPVRYDVFVVEQEVPLELEWDDMDAHCIHAVAYDANDAPIATGRLLPDGHIGRVAVVKPARGQGIGAAIMQALMKEARQRGDAFVVLSAQVHAAPFYERLGFVREGCEFMEAGIPHIGMRHDFTCG